MYVFIHSTEHRLCLGCVEIDHSGNDLEGIDDVIEDHWTMFNDDEPESDNGFVDFLLKSGVGKDIGETPDFADGGHNHVWHVYVD